MSGVYRYKIGNVDFEVTPYLKFINGQLHQAMIEQSPDTIDNAQQKLEWIKVQSVELNKGEEGNMVAKKKKATKKKPAKKKAAKKTTKKKPAKKKKK